MRQGTLRFAHERAAVTDIWHDGRPPHRRAARYAEGRRAACDEESGQIASPLAAIVKTFQQFRLTRYYNNTTMSRIKSKFTWSKFGFADASEDQFYHSQWREAIPQPVFVAYRVFLAVYFLIWLVVSILEGGGIIGGPKKDQRSESPPSLADSHGNSSANRTDELSNVDEAGYLWYIFLTNWSFVLFNVYLTVSAINVAFAYLKTRFSPVPEKPITKSPKSLPILCKLHWTTYNLQVGLNILVCVGFWSILVPFTPAIQNDLNVISLHVHLINGLVTLGDVFMVAIPVRLPHLYQTLIVSSSWVLFSIIYWQTGGTPFPIYAFLNYRDAPATAAILLIGFSVVVLPLMWLGVYGLTALRVRLSRRRQTEGLSMSQSAQTMSESRQTMSGSGQTMSESWQTMSESVQTMSESVQTMSESVQTMSDSRQTMSEFGQTMSESGQTLSDSGQTLSDSGQTLSDSGQTFDLSVISELDKKEGLV
ncbi:hypothetical protein BV898_15293 [Hypsibius exemplaris]|uniref:Protein rolling stone n=1 Tax=Hypsibius exemplaris TaxID=2072580 RepID=A0A9X6NHJ4_HYPEX|nr:hypothetical protein BV898_15293 [Hypsibius exemplaris]